MRSRRLQAALGILLPLGIAADEEPCHIVIPSEQRERGISPNFVSCVIAPRGRCHSERSVPTDFPPEIVLFDFRSGREVEESLLDFPKNMQLSAGT